MMINKRLFTFAALVAWGHASSIMAQDAPDGVPPVPVPVVDDAGLVTSDQPAIDANTDAVLENGIMFPSASIIRVILPIYQDLTGKRVILDTNIADNNVRVVLRGPVSREDAVAFIEETLLLNGYAFVPTTRSSTVKLLNVAGKNPGPEGAAVYNDQMPLPNTDEVITYIMGLKNIMPEEAMQVFQVSTPLHPYGTIAAVPNTSSLVITENVSLVRRLLALREAIDKPSASIVREFIQLERADAERVAELLQEILAPEDAVENRLALARERFIQQRNQRNNRGNNSQGSNPGDGNNTPQTVTGNLTATEGAAPPVKIVPDVRTNRILVMARAVDVEYVKGLVAEFDAPNTARTFLQRQLSHTSASILLPLIADAISRESGEESSGGSSGAQSSVQNTGNTSGGRNNNSQGLAGLDGRSGGNIGNSSQGFRSNNQPTPAGASSTLIGKTLLIADNEQNAIIVSGPPEYIELADKLIEQLDIRQRQVVLATVIGQYNLNDRTEVGVDLVRTLQNVSNNPEVNIAGMNNTGAGAGIVDTNTLTDIAEFPGANGLSIYGRFAGNLSAYVRALETTGKFRVLSRPVVFTGNNQEAVIQSGQRIAVPGTTLTTANNSGVGNDNAAISSTIQYRDVVLQLQIRPLINSDDQVRLEIYQVNDTIAGSRNIGGNDVPTIATQELVTTVTVANGQSVLIGGLITETEQKSRSGVPILKDIPLVKYLFSTRTTEVSRDELMIFIQPWIVDDEESLKEVNLSEFDRAESGPGVLRFADPRAQTDEVPLPIWEGKASNHPDPEVRRAIPVREKVHNALFD